LEIYTSRSGTRSVLECSRDERIAALDELPRLVEALKSEAVNRIEKIQRAKELLTK
jgi:hypothetical protein